MTVKCENCGKFVPEEKIIWDMDEGMEFCPYCGEGNSLIDIAEDVTEQ